MNLWQPLGVSLSTLILGNKSCCIEQKFRLEFKLKNFSQFQKSSVLIAPWLILQGIGSIEGVTNNIMHPSSCFAILLFIEAYVWIAVLSLYKIMKRDNTLNHPMSH